MTSVTGVTVGSVLNVINGYLPCRVWLPYDAYNTPIIFWITSVQQIITLIFAAVINAGIETLICGFILQICAQIDIFQNRLYELVSNKIPMYMNHSLVSSCRRKSVFAEYICHHLQIYELVIFQLNDYIYTCI